MQSSRKLSYFNNNHTNFSLQPCTVRSLLEGMDKTEALKEVYVFSELSRSLNFAEVLTMTNKLAQGLLKMGLKKSDILALSAPNLPETMCLFFAAAFIGVVVVLVNPCYKLSEFEYILRTTGAKCLCITDQQGAIDPLELVNHFGLDWERSHRDALLFTALPNLKHLILATNGNPSDLACKDLSWDLTRDLLNSDEQSIDLPEVDTEDPLLIYLSVSDRLQLCSNQA